MVRYGDIGAGKVINRNVVSGTVVGGEVYALYYVEAVQYFGEVYDC